MINYECPDDDKTYVHRIGRTGRAGASGIAVTFVDWADQTRWKVINNTLGLPFEEPEETYSTSAHLYHDLGIDPAAKGRIVPPKPPRDTGDARSRERPRANASGRSDREADRRRLRNGVPVERDGADRAIAPAEAAETAASAEGVRGRAGADAPPATPEPQRRRRPRPHRGSDEVLGRAARLAPRGGHRRPAQSLSGPGRAAWRSTTRLLS